MKVEVVIVAEHSPYTYHVELQKAGYEPELLLCMLPDEVPHALVRVNELYLDNRKERPSRKTDCVAVHEVKL